MLITPSSIEFVNYICENPYKKTKLYFNKNTYIYKNNKLFINKLHTDNMHLNKILLLGFFNFKKTIFYMSYNAFFSLNISNFSFNFLKPHFKVNANQLIFLKNYEQFKYKLLIKGHYEYKELKMFKELFNIFNLTHKKEYSMLCKKLIQLTVKDINETSSISTKSC